MKEYENLSEKNLNEAITEIFENFLNAEFREEPEPTNLASSQPPQKD